MTNHPAPSTLTVELATHRYPIYFGTELAASLAAFTASGGRSPARSALVVDANVARQHQDWIETAFPGSPRFTVPSGENSKNLDCLGQLLSFLAGARIDRSSTLYALGGGVTGDLAGFAAACYLRGIPFVQIPTTLLAMVDSSVGGKTGINLPEGKNLVGAFHQPQAVFADVRFLATLPPREFAAGMAEVIKYALLGDATFFRQLESIDPPLHPAHPQLPSIIRHCCEMKSAIVRDDERETAQHNGRALLNLGHTFAHAIEAVAGYGLYLHGEAVAIGLRLAAELSVQTSPAEGAATFSPADSQRVESLLQRYALPTRLSDPLCLERLLEAMTRDKKVRAAQLRLVLMQAIGQAYTTAAPSTRTIADLWLQHGARN